MSENLNNCPVCNNISFVPFLSVKDHFLSQETFMICSCTSCGFRFINPRPGQAEIGKYYQSTEYISHNAAGFSLINSLYKIARYFAIRTKYQLILRTSSGKKLLDIGCGTGELLRYCGDHGFEVSGVEPTEPARKFAIEQNRIDVKESLQELVKGGVRHNCITLWHVLEHIHNLNETLVQIKELLDKNGSLILALPNCESDDAQRYKEYWAAYDVPRHLYHFTKGTLEKIADKHGFVVTETIPQKLDSYYVSILSEKYKRGSTNYISAFFSGWRSNRQAKKTGSGHSSLIFLLSLKKT